MHRLPLLLLGLLLIAAAGCGEDDAPRAQDPLKARLERIGAELSRLGYDVDMRGVRIERRNPGIGIETLPAAWRPERPDVAAGRMHVWTRLMNGADSGPYDEGLEGYYAPWRNTIVLFDRGSGANLDYDELIAHEAMHVRQGRLRALFSRAWHLKRRTSEGEAVLECLYEGEAEVGALAFRLARRAATLADLKEDAVDRGIDQGTAGPPAFLPYVYGRRLVLRLLRTEGTVGIDRLFKTPPASTEQMIHPEKWGKDAPTLVVWPEGVLPDATLIYEDTLGELRIQQWLAWFYGRPTASAGSTGWDGDAVRVYRNDDGSLTSLWVTIWDREQDAEEFHELARGLSGAREEARTTFKRAGRLVLGVAGPNEATVDALLARAQKLFPSPDVIAEDAASTARIAAELERDHKEVHVKGGVTWELPMLGIHMPVPEYWREALSQGVIVLQRAQFGVGPMAEIRASTRAMGRATSPGEVKALLSRLHEDAPGEHVISVEDVDLAGTPAILAERAISYRSSWYPFRVLVLYIPHGKGLLVVEAGVHDDSRELAWDQARRALLGVRFLKPSGR